MNIYTKTVCPKCMLLKSMLDSQGVGFTTINIDNDEEGKSKLVEQGIMAVPALEIEGVFYTEISEMNKIISELQQ